MTRIKKIYTDLL